MSKLYHTETGNVVPTLCEEVTEYRRARKVLRLPGTDAPAKLFVLARSYPDNVLPLKVSVNGTEVAGLAPKSSATYAWHEVVVPPSLVVSGTNQFEFWAEAQAMNAWSVALENGHKEPGSFVSTNGGETWRNEKMGYLNVSRGEYLVRVRLAEGTDPPPPSIVWEDTDSPRLERLRCMLPDGILQSGPMLDQVRALMTWVCTCWEYRNSSNSVVYAPWDAETIMAWGQAARGHDGREPVVMCVHYAVAYVSFCLALGIPARCAVFTQAINSAKGHFAAEVWFEEHGKWVMVDPNNDAILFEGDNPLSVKEIQRAGSDLTDLIRWGPGHEFQVKNPLMEAWIPETYLNGSCFVFRGIWPRTDFLSRPELAPAGHGSTAYCETDLVWERGDLHQGFGMFPYFGDSDYFDAPPCFPSPISTTSSS